MLELKNIFLHCSGTPWGEVLTFDAWHRQRGWSGVGYHYIVLNGRPHQNVVYWDFLDGQIQPGRSLDDDPIFELDEVGAHVAGRNRESLGICLVGRDAFSLAQLETSYVLIHRLLKHFNLKVANVLGHYEDPHAQKTCPNIPMEYFRKFLDGSIRSDELVVRIAKYNQVDHA